jgi:hypothetical protein
MERELPEKREGTANIVANDEPKSRRKATDAEKTSQKILNECTGGGKQQQPGN